MRRFFVFMLILVASSACAQQGVLPHSIDSSGIPKPNSQTKPMFVTPVAPDGGTSTVDLIMPAIALATPTSTTIATSAVTTLQSVASYPLSTLVNFQPSQDIFYAAFSGATPTAAWLRLNGKKMTAYSTPILYSLKPTCDMAFLADSAVATLSLEFAEVQ